MGLYVLPPSVVNRGVGTQYALRSLGLSALVQLETVSYRAGIPE